MRVRGQETGEKEGERRKEKEGEKKKRRKGKEKEEERKRERKKRKERGGIRGGRSRVGDRQLSGTGWDGGEEKEGGVRSAEKGEEKMERQLKSGVGTAKISGKELGFRVN